MTKEFIRVDRLDRCSSASQLASEEPTRNLSNRCQLAATATSGRSGDVEQHFARRRATLEHALRLGRLPQRKLRADAHRELAPRYPVEQLPRAPQQIFPSRDV